MSCFRVWSNRPPERLNFHVSSISPLPKSYTDAFNDPNWQNDGTLSHYKARLVANGSTHLEGIDVDETFSLVVKPRTIQTVLCLFMGSSRLLELGFSDLHPILLVLGFIIVVVTHLCLSIDKGTYTAYLLLYVDDIVLTASSETLLQQRKYLVEIIERDHMANCNPSRTPVDTESKLGDDGDLVPNLTLYQSLSGSLQYLTFTRPDISYVVHQVCLYMHDPQEPHFSALKRTLRLGRMPYYSERPSIVVLLMLLLRLVGCRIFCHQRTKHIEIDIHFVRDLFAAGRVCVLHVPSRYQYADIFTKGLPSALFDEFRTSLRVWCSPAPTAREC
ncbi:ribonuclease H-like domain-containing protein [Tanacetum coccineum]|uniref:Ribonuclease H-like domain-containing protein n=1 Tax=Tanacetum coccineum TaxID=301880 RepID=A0ABQ5F0U3_9ASTR